MGCWWLLAEPVTRTSEQVVGMADKGKAGARMESHKEIEASDKEEPNIPAWLKIG